LKKILCSGLALLLLCSCAKWPRTHNGFHVYSLDGYQAYITYVNQDVWRYQERKQKKISKEKANQLNIPEGGKFILTIRSVVQDLSMSQWSYTIETDDKDIIDSGPFGFGFERVRQEYDFERGWRTYPAKARKDIPLSKKYEGNLYFTLKYDNPEYSGDSSETRLKFPMDLSTKVEKVQFQVRI